jgi:hypothetical protein
MMARARASIIRACGQPPRDYFAVLSGLATVTGVGRLPRLELRAGAVTFWGLADYQVNEISKSLPNASRPSGCCATAWRTSPEWESILEVVPLELELSPN